MLFARYSDSGFYFTPSQSPTIDFVARHRLFAVGASSPKMVLFSLVTFLTGEQCCGSIFCEAHCSPEKITHRIPNSNQESCHMSPKV